MFLNILSLPAQKNVNSVHDKPHHLHLYLRNKHEQNNEKRSVPTFLPHLMKFRKQEVGYFRVPQND